jgi:hypothetical protein
VTAKENPVGISQAGDCIPSATGPRGRVGVKPSPVVQCPQSAQGLFPEMSRTVTQYLPDGFTPQSSSNSVRVDHEGSRVWRERIERSARKFHANGEVRFLEPLDRSGDGEVVAPNDVLPADPNRWYG